MTGAVIIEIRAGAGGEEAALFARRLADMYIKYAQQKNWRVSMIDESNSDLGGIRELVFSIRGEGSYEDFKHESGVHRVQRVPKTEKTGRIHTSTASVCLPPQH